MGWKRKTGIILGILILLYTLAGFLVIPMVTEAILPEKLSAQLDRPVSVESISLNPYTLTLAVHGLKIGEKSGDAAFVSFDEFFADIQWASLFKWGLVARELRLTAPFVRVARISGTKFNFSDLMPADKEEPSPAPEEEALFQFRLSNIRIINGGFEFHDRPMDKTHRFANVSFTIPVLSNFDPHIHVYSQPVLAGELNDTQFKVDVSTKPFAESLETVVDITVTGVDLPYYFDYLPVDLGLDITGGNLNLESKIRFKKASDGKNDLEVSAVADLANLQVTDTAGDEILALSGLHAEMAPSRPLEKHIRFSAVSLTEPVVTIVRDVNGNVNLARIGPQGASDSENKEAETGQSRTGSETAAPSAPFQGSIGEIQLRDIGVSFADYSVEPNYSARVIFDEGSITGLSTEAFERAKISLKGAVNERAPIDISGRINPFLADLLLDISVKLENMELSPVSAYSGKYIGKVIKKGKLNLDLEYSIENKKVEADNHVLLDQFNLGHEVESEIAVNLPVELAIALLKDRSGKIELDLPVSGRLDDPEFNLTSMILQSLMSLAAKAATSPFALVSSIVSGGEELRYIEFEAGSAELNGASKDKLDAIIKLLYERPVLDLELTGFVAPEKDRAALKAAALERKVRAAEWAETSEQTETETETIPFAEIALTDEEYVTYLRQVYKAEVLGAPDAPIDVKPLDDESLTAEEMAAEIRQRIEITDAGLRLLARNRVESVKGYILNDDRIAVKGLFIRKAENLMPSDAGKFKASRVELSLN